MNVTCHNCKTKLSIPDHKIPLDRESIFKCPKCKEKVHIPAVKRKQSVSDDKPQSFYSAFDDRLKALVCVDRTDLKQKVVESVRQMGLTAETVENTREALKKLEYHVYHLVVVDDAFDENKGFSGILDRMNTVDMSLRRRICLVWICNTFNTNDNMASLHTSVNTIIHLDDTTQLEPLLSSALTAHKNVYTVYRDCLKLSGKA